MSVRKRTWKNAAGEIKEAWVVDYVDGKGERHNETFQRKRDADARHAVVKVDVSKGVHTPTNRSITVAAAAWMLAQKQGGVGTFSTDQIAGFYREPGR